MQSLQRNDAGTLSPFFSLIFTHTTFCMHIIHCWLQVFERYLMKMEGCKCQTFSKHTYHTVPNYNHPATLRVTEWKYGSILYVKHAMWFSRLAFTYVHNLSHCMYMYVFGTLAVSVKCLIRVLTLLSLTLIMPITKPTSQAYVHINVIISGRVYPYSFSWHVYIFTCTDMYVCERFAS